VSSGKSETLSRSEVFKGKVFRVDRDRVRLPHGPEVDLEVVRHSGSVVLIPMPEPGHVILARQYRYAVSRWLWELPAGRIDDGETPEDAARRECHEEIGLRPRVVDLLGTYLPTPGYCDEFMMIFIVAGLEQPPEAATPDEDESIEARTFTIDEAMRTIEAEVAVDMKTALGLRLLMERG
jgi:ADP-ribose pyrophosphatase